MGIPFLGDHFGAKDTIPTRDDDGAYVRSSASKTTFVWDHGQHSRDFTHDARSLPVLTLDTGVGYFQAFCTRVRRKYEDTVHFAFSSAHSIITDEPMSPIRSRVEIAPVTLTQILLSVRMCCTLTVVVLSQGWFTREPRLMACGILFEETMV